MGWADGGYFGFDPANPRRYLFSQQNAQTDGTVVPPLPTPNIVNPILADLPETLAPLQAMGVTIGVIPSPPGFLNGGANNSPFVPVVAQDPATPNQFIFGWRQAGGGAGTDTGAYSSINAGLTAVPLAALAVPSPLVANNADCSAACFGPTFGGNAEGWIGFSTGALIRTATAPVGPWVAPATPLPAAALGQPISRILVHPSDERIVVVCTTGSTGVPAPQGRACISYDRGLSWQDITARTPASITVTPAAPSLARHEVRQFTATAAFADGSSFDATASVAWTSSTPATGAFSTQVGEEGQFTAAAAGNTTVTASFAGVGGAVAGNTVVTVTAAEAAAAPPLPLAPRQFDLASLPPGPLTSLEFEPVADATRLFAGTLAGVYVLPGVPVPTAVTIGNATPLNLPLGHTAQLTASLTMSSGPPVPATTEVDWTAAPPGIVTFGVGPLASQITGAAAGATVVTARRGRHTITLNVNVTAAAPPIPPVPGPPAAMVAPPVAVAWAPFNAGLPLVLVNEITHSAAAGANLLRIATFGRGVWDCNLAAPALAQNLFIRQMPIDDGRMPRAVPAALTDDPRLPAGIVGLDFTHAFDIRVDAPPYRFFDDRVDGVEFDERLGADNLHPTKPNAIYVQVHNNGRASADTVNLHLYFRASPAAAPVGPPPGAAVPALGAVAEFYNPPSFDPTAGGDPVAGATWTRVAPVREIPRIRPGEPVVVRFDWTPPPALAGQAIALMALCGSKAGQDALPAAPAAAPGIAAFVAAERRAALRVLAVDPLPLADLVLRSAVDDDGGAAGAATSLLRSPDIIVSPGAPPSPPATAFRDLLDARPQDHLQAGQANHLYVRVHNRGAAVVHAEVQLFALRVGADLLPDPDNTRWIRITPTPPAKLEVDVPAGGWVLAETSWTPVDPAPGDASFVLLALVTSADNNDPLPPIGGVNSAATLAALLARPGGSNNVAARAVRLRT